MKRFFFKAGIFLLIGSLIFIILNIVANGLDRKDSIYALAVGNSHTCAFDFNVLKIYGYRVAQGGNDVFEAEYQLRSLVPMLPKLKTVIFNISYFSLFLDNSAIPNDVCYFTDKEYNLFLSKYPRAKFEI